MKHDLKSLLNEVEKKVGKNINVSSDFEKLAQVFSNHKINLTPPALKGVWEHFKTKEKLSVKTLDKIALFVGFQSWNDFQNMLHGEDDGQTSYESDDEKETKQE